MEDIRYNSAVYTSLAANEILITLVPSNHFEPGVNLNTIRPEDYLFRILSVNTTSGKEYGELGYQTDSHEIQLFGSMLKGYNPDAPSYEDLTPSQCTNLYNTDFLSNRRNLFLITNYTFDATHNDSLLYMISNREIPQSHWMCFFSQKLGSRCKYNEVALRVGRGLPWLVPIKKGKVVEIRRCKSERIVERCKVQFSLGIMFAVICCNLVKACCMVMTVVRSQEPTLVTLGDAIDSFLRVPDPTTMGICFADRRFIEKEWGRRFRAGPREWKQKGVQRWWTSVSKMRWIICNFSCSMAIIITGVLLGKGIGQDGKLMSTDIKSL